MKVWTVANQKGGVGKTTTAVALGGLAAEAGLRVLLIDLDPHGSLTNYFGYNPDEMSASVYTLFAERTQLNRDLIAQVTLTTRFPRLSLIPAATALATLERGAAGQDGLGLVISRTLAQVYEDYDQVIIDTPPQLGVLMINALASADRLLIPVQTEFLAIKGLERMVHTLNMMAKSRQRQLPYTIIPTMFDRRTQASVGSLRELRNRYEAHLWPRKIPVDTKFRDASRAGVPPHQFEPDSHGVEAYQSLYKWLNKQAPEAVEAAG